MAETENTAATHDVTCTYCGTEWELTDDEVQRGVFFCEDCRLFFNVEEGKALYDEMNRIEQRNGESIRARFYLKRLRMRTCYGSLRRLIRIGAGIGYLLVVIQVLLLVYSAIRGGMFEISFVVIMPTIAALISILILSLLLQLLVDMADAYLEKNSRRR